MKQKSRGGGSYWFLIDLLGAILLQVIENL